MYGCEALQTSKKYTNKMQVFTNRCLRRILNIKWMDKISNQKIWTRTKQIPVEVEIGKRRWKWIGHTLRKPYTSITRKALEWNPQGKRSRGRPKGTWKRVMEEDIDKSGQAWTSIKKMAQDRDGWKAFVGGLYPDTG